MLRIETADGSWACEPVLLARRFLTRLLGMTMRGRGKALLLRGSSVHTMWMSRTITVVFLDEAGVVLSGRPALPGLVYRDHGAAWVLEIDGSRSVPSPGSRCNLLLSSPTCPES